MHNFLFEDVVLEKYQLDVLSIFIHPLGSKDKMQFMMKNSEAS
jgi:hypothetical protein